MRCGECGGCRNWGVEREEHLTTEDTEDTAGHQGHSTTQGESLRGSSCFAQGDKDLGMRRDTMTIAMESMAVAMPEVEGHPNRAEFRGVLTVVDSPSQRAPSGSNGRRVVLTKAAAEAALPSLLGMGLDYAPTFDRHDTRRKVGVITSAEVVGRNLEVGGYLYAKDFPDIVAEVGKSGRRKAFGGLQTAGNETGMTYRDHGTSTFGLGISGVRADGVTLRASLSSAASRIRTLASALRGKPHSGERVAALRAEAGGGVADELGMSFEVTDVLVADTRARVWTLMKVTFTGAAILRKNKAAYEGTWIGLSR